jgi:hypothetical protein
MSHKRNWKTSPLPKILAIGGITLLVIAILAFKEKPQAASPTANPNAPAEAQLDRALQAGQPVLAFFTLGDGCECQMNVIRSAEAQLADWPFIRTGIFWIQRVDYNRRPDLVRQYNVARAPALVLLDSLGQVVWKQDLGLTDDAPLDLIEAQSQVEKLLSESK